MPQCCWDAEESPPTGASTLSKRKIGVGWGHGAGNGAARRGTLCRELSQASPPTAPTRDLGRQTESGGAAVGREMELPGGAHCVWS